MYEWRQAVTLGSGPVRSAIEALMYPVLLSEEDGRSIRRSRGSLPIMPVVWARRLPPRAGDWRRIGQAAFHESIWIRSLDLCLDPDRRGRPRGQRRGDRPGARSRSPTATSCSSPSCASPATPAPTCSARRPCSTPALRARQADRRGDARGGSSSSSSACRCRSATACSTAAWCSPTARSWASCPSSSSPTTRSSTRAAGSARPTGPSRRRSTSPADGCPFGIDLLFECRRRRGTRRGGRRDLRGPVGADPAQLGAGDRRGDVLLNLSASNETIGKSRYRTDLVVGQSGRCIAAYAYAGAGPTESTTDLVFGGHCLIAENGRLLAESPRVGDGQADPPRLVLRSPATSTSPSSSPTAGRRPASTTAPRYLPAVPADPVRPGRATMAGLQAGRAGHAVRARRGARAAPPLRRDLRHPVRGAGQADRAAPGRHAAEHRRLRRARLDAGAAGRRQDLRHAGPRPPADPRADDARLRHDRSGRGPTPST